MRKRGKNSGVIGLGAIFLGIVIILSLVLPGTFWWFVLAIALIAGGLFFIKSC